MRASAPSRLSRAWLLGPLALGFVLIVCGFWLTLRSPEHHTASHVVRAIRDVAREGASGKPGSGVLGPWRISAQGVDAATGDLLDFRLESGPVVLAAERARVIVDVAANTFAIEVETVVYTRLPDEEDADALVHTMDRYLLGPAAWGVEIVDDGDAPVPPAGTVVPLAPTVDPSGLVRALEAIESP